MSLLRPLQDQRSQTWRRVFESENVVPESPTHLIVSMGQPPPKPNSINTRSSPSLMPVWKDTMQPFSPTAKRGRAKLTRFWETMSREIHKVFCPERFMHSLMPSNNNKRTRPTTTNETCKIPQPAMLIKKILLNLP